MQLSPRAEIWCMYVTSSNDGTQILAFPGINNNRDFPNSRFFYGDLIVLNSELQWFLFPDRSHLLHLFSELRTGSCAQGIISAGYLQRCLCLDSCALDDNVWFTALSNLKNNHNTHYVNKYYTMYCKFTVCKNMNFRYLRFLLSNTKIPCFRFIHGSTWHQKLLLNYISCIIIGY